MIQVLNNFRKPSLQEKIVNEINEAYNDVLKVLPQLPKVLNIWFNTEYGSEIIFESGIGGHAHTKNTMTIAYDEDFGGDEALRSKEFRALVFHEAYHMVHGWVFEGSEWEDKQATALEQAFYEGAAEVFAREYSGFSASKISDYSNLGNLKDLLKEVAELGYDFNWEEWKFFHPKKGQGWILYRVGAYMIDQYLAKNKGKTIMDILNMRAEDVASDLGLI